MSTRMGECFPHFPSVKSIIFSFVNENNFGITDMFLNINSVAGGTESYLVTVTLSGGV